MTGGKSGGKASGTKTSQSYVGLLFYFYFCVYGFI